jgi:hypothetical protein
MKRWKWKCKPFAVVHPRRGQKYRVAQMCATWRTTGKPPIAQLADVFGISPGLIYQAMRDARPNGCSNGHARHVNEHKQRPVVVEPAPLIDPVIKPAVEPVKSVKFPIQATWR